MKIVIDIPDNEYELLQRGTTIGTGVDADNCLRYYILDGTVLPKGHGDLVDKDTITVEEDVYFQNYIIHAPTVIPADEGE